MSDVCLCVSGYTRVMELWTRDGALDTKVLSDRVAIRRRVIHSTELLTLLQALLLRSPI